MKEFAHSLADLFSIGLPPLFVSIICSCLGAFCGLVVWYYVKKGTGKTSDPLEMLFRFMVSWIAGCFVGPLIAPGFQAVLKNVPENFITYVAGASGYTILEKYIPKKIESMDDTSAKPPES